MTIIRKFHDHQSAQCYVREYTDGHRELVSYTTTVIEVDPEGWLLVNGLYSRTTIKHIGWFMRELGLDYYLAKHLYLDKKAYNIFSGKEEDR